MTKFASYELNPIQTYGTMIFLSPEAEKQFNEAPEEVKNYSIALLSKCINKSMRELVDDTICKKLNELENRIKSLEVNEK